MMTAMGWKRWDWAGKWPAELQGAMGEAAEEIEGLGGGRTSGVAKTTGQAGIFGMVSGLISWLVNCELVFYLSNEKNHGWLGYIGHYTPQLYRHYNTP